MSNQIDLLLQTQYAQEILSEYNILLSAGLSDSEAEEAVSSFFLSNSSEDQKDLFQILFALIQWNMGRLSEKSFTAAMRCVHNDFQTLPYCVVEKLVDILLSPMPKRQAVKKLRAIKCPWKLGTLLSYKISTNSKLAASRFWHHYVLLRIVEIKRWPISAIKPDLLYDESMCVALYNWVGSSLPNVIDLSTLEYTPISIRGPMLSLASNNLHLGLYKGIVSDDQINTAIDEGNVHFVYALDWKRKKNREAVFTIVEDGSNTHMASLDCWENLQKKIPPMIGLTGFDTILERRLTQLFSEDVAHN